MIQNQSRNRRFNSKLNVIKDRIYNPIFIVKILSPFFVGVILILLISYISVNLSYSKKLIPNEESIPSEINTSTIILTPLNFETSESSKIFSTNESLYNSRKLSNINIYIIGLNSGEESVKSEISSKLSKVNEEIIKYNFEYKNIEDVCIDLEQSNSQKGILFTSGENLLRSMYLCNSFNLYYTGFKSEDDEGFSNIKYITFDLFIKDFIKNIFNIY